MELHLILADHCPTCTETERVWLRVARELGLACTVVLTEEAEGARLAAALNLSTFPALVVDGRIRAIGAPSEATARETLHALARQPAHDAS